MSQCDVIGPIKISSPGVRNCIIGFVLADKDDELAAAPTITPPSGLTIDGDVELTTTTKTIGGKQVLAGRAATYTLVCASAQSGTKTLSFACETVDGDEFVATQDVEIEDFEAE